ncbi:hypothetical protein GCM10023220_61790 [Streptomyces ziwulingensis]|uniref:Uncharacterized protein n=1 Tax=Streptomyces ziwulingensis TaxID=1045501 RepID=A0ABP9CWI8_9ACTN
MGAGLSSSPVGRVGAAAGHGGAALGAAGYDGASGAWCCGVRGAAVCVALRGMWCLAVCGVVRRGTWSFGVRGASGARKGADDKGAGTAKV